MNVYEKWSKIVTQSRTLFPGSTADDHLEKLRQELVEVKDAPKSKRLIEYADVFLCFVAAMEEDDFNAADLDAAVDYKLAVNRTRKWERMPDGTFQHVKGT